MVFNGKFVFLVFVGKKQTIKKRVPIQSKAKSRKAGGREGKSRKKTKVSKTFFRSL